MTAGSGIIHQEMPKGDAAGLMWGFQLWANLPAEHKMMDPRYRDIIAGQIPEVTVENGVKIKIICGTVNGEDGPVEDIVIDPEYLDVMVPPNTEFVHAVITYEVEGANYFDIERDPFVSQEHLVLFEKGDSIIALTEEDPVRFLLISGKPINEPVAWHGPIVMNTREELKIAFEEYQNGTFIKHTS
jgi:redox-sensitive bicupin YhaK (pirin superfamily)